MTPPVKAKPEGPGRGKRITPNRDRRHAANVITKLYAAPDPRFTTGFKMSTNVPAGCSCPLAWSDLSSPNRCSFRCCPGYTRSPAHQEVALAMIRSLLHSLLHNRPTDEPLATCEIWLSRKKRRPANSNSPRVRPEQGPELRGNSELQALFFRHPASSQAG
jgi:hypothetical protein